MVCYAASLKHFMIYGGVYALAGSVYFRDAALIQKSGSKYINVQNQTPRTRTSNRQRSRYQLLRPLLHPASNKTWMVLIIWTSDPASSADRLTLTNMFVFLQSGFSHFMLRMLQRERPQPQALMSLCNISPAFKNEGAALSLSRKSMKPGEQASSSR